MRKNWTMTEMLEIARRKERITAVKAKENLRTHTADGYQGLANLPKAETDIPSNLTKCSPVDSRKSAWRSGWNFALSRTG